MPLIGLEAAAAVRVVREASGVPACVSLVIPRIPTVRVRTVVREIAVGVVTQRRAVEIGYLVGCIELIVTHRRGQAGPARTFRSSASPVRPHRTGIEDFPQCCRPRLGVIAVTRDSLS